MINTKITINGTELEDTKKLVVQRSIGDFNATSNFKTELDTPYGRHSSDFSLNDEVIIYADKDVGGYNEQTIESYNETSGTNTNAYLTNWIAQSFTLGTTGFNQRFNLTKVKLKSFKTGSPGTLTVSIKAVDGAGKPTGADLSTGTFNGNDLTGANTWFTVNMSAYELQKDTKYAIVCRVLDGDASNRVYFNYVVNTATYTGGDFLSSGDSGSTWLVYNTTDLLFEVLGDFTPTKIFSGLVEDIQFSGEGTKSRLRIRGRDYGAILQDIITQPRVFKDAETSTIVQEIMDQNVVNSITTNNINVTSTTIDRVTFTNISVFDALVQLAEISGFYFYVDEDKDLHFEERDSTSSGLTFNNTNTLTANIRQSDSKIFNRVTVHGERQLTGVRQIFTTGTDNTGSSYILTDKPHSTIVTTSGPTDVVLSPGGVVNIDDPALDNIKYLVDFQGKNITLVSGTGGGGDNIQATGSVVIFDYQRSTPIISLQQDLISQQDYGLKDKNIIDTNVKSQEEASVKAVSFLNENKDPKIQADLQLKGIIDVVPGNTAVLDLPDFNQSSQTYRIINVAYHLNPRDTQADSVLEVTLSKKIADFVDLMKQEALRLRALESSQFDANVTTLETISNPVQVSGLVVAYNRSIGSAFYFNVDGHDILESPKSLLGDMRTGSSVLTLT